MTVELRGCYPILATPFLPDGEIDEGSVAELIRHLKTCGLPGFTMFGLASEFYKLSDADRETLIETAFRARAPDQTVIVSVTAHSHEVAVKQARRAEQRGVERPLRQGRERAARAPHLFYNRRLIRRNKMPRGLRWTATRGRSQARRGRRPAGFGCGRLLSAYLGGFRRGRPRSGLRPARRCTAPDQPAHAGHRAAQSDGEDRPEMARHHRPRLLPGRKLRARRPDTGRTRPLRRAYRHPLAPFRTVAFMIKGVAAPPTSPTRPARSRPPPVPSRTRTSSSPPAPAARPKPACGGPAVRSAAPRPRPESLRSSPALSPRRTSRSRRFSPLSPSG